MCGYTGDGELTGIRKGAECAHDEATPGQSDKNHSHPRSTHTAGKVEETSGLMVRASFGTLGSNFYTVTMSVEKTEYLSNVYHPHKPQMEGESEKLGFPVWPL